jgi:hypothetical protein
MNPSITSVDAAINLRGATFGYGSVSFYDEIDAALIDRGIEIGSGLYVSNNALFPANAAVSQLGLGAASIYSVRIPGVWTSSDSQVINAIPTNGAFISLSTDAGGAGSTAIFYMGPPNTGSPFTGVYAGSNITG